MKRFIHYAVLSAVLSTATILPSFWAQVAAKSAPILVSQNVNFKPPDVTAPDNRQGATHRGPCPENLDIIPLIPRSNKGLTVAESPTFFAYVSDPAIPVKFTLQTIEDADAKEVYTTTFKVDKPGIVGVSIPIAGASKKSLEVGKEYRWSFAGICNPDDPADASGHYLVSGLVSRIEVPSNLQSNLANPDPMARAIAYANNGIWYDTISSLAAMRRQAPDNSELTAQWQQLLKSQGLDSIAAQPLLEPL
ncbi:MAG: DUF928 domain-containing protein [Oscillatoriaceae cyanobacterium Prado104]|jgi:hypothetical protein|nr:DUF928 domain-containing protein [Oscillatoriaceae cyanobacterium Prado104]